MEEEVGLGGAGVLEGFGVGAMMFWELRPELGSAEYTVAPRSF